MQGMAAVRLHYERSLASDVWNKINQSNFPHSRCSSKIVRLILLLHDTSCNLFNGEEVLFKKKSLGCGIYEVWMERR